uniref:Acetaldehyde dehydrogenase 2 n=1 Tax=Salinispora arenicola (strain CNS-205) TaxID=391037 RepID=ACDH2_SALAI|nr:RecName: Full=Acetaldehyde dehydrogenase 2; AltName: Full=Acetaldehyde dehydrogenase [acetylating] 2 [Salinispora arenicola CNS-205]
MSTQTHPAPLRTAIVGTGNIGTDLLLKVEASPLLTCVLFAGRRAESPGIELARGRGVATSTGGIDAVVDAADDIDLVFDATSARDAVRHWAVIKPLGLPFIDLTPANQGKFCVPALNLEDCLDEQYLSMVTCGGQAAVPMARCITQIAGHVDYLEIVSASASASVGPASRANLDEYVHTTEQATAEFCSTARTKTVLIINPADPGIVMRNSIAVSTTERIDIDALRDSVTAMEKEIHSYVPGYRIVVPPVATGDCYLLTVEVEGLGDYFPRSAGNLDIITCAAVAAAEARSGLRR